MSPLDDVGNGLPLLLLHAFPLSRRMWQPQLAALAGSCRLLAPDLPGFSDAVPTPPQLAPAAATAAGGRTVDVCTMDAMAASMAALLDQLEIAQAVVCGLSMGGYVALALYQGWPQRVRGLVLASTRASADDAAGRQRRQQSALAIETRGPGEALAGFIPSLLGAASRTANPDLVAWLGREIAAAPAAGAAAAQRGMGERPDRTPLLPRIAVPTLVLAAAEDEIVPAADTHRLAETIPGAQLTVIPEAGHLANLEQPDAFNRALEGFLKTFA